MNSMNSSRAFHFGIIYIHYQLLNAILLLTFNCYDFASYYIELFFFLYWRSKKANNNCSPLSFSIYHDCFGSFFSHFIRSLNDAKHAIAIKSVDITPALRHTHMPECELADECALLWCRSSDSSIEAVHSLSPGDKLFQRVRFFPSFVSFLFQLLYDFCSSSIPIYRIVVCGFI